MLAPHIAYAGIRRLPADQFHPNPTGEANSCPRGSRAPCGSSGFALSSGRALLQPLSCPFLGALTVLAGRPLSVCPSGLVAVSPLRSWGLSPFPCYALL